MASIRKKDPNNMFNITKAYTYKSFNPSFKFYFALMKKEKVLLS